MIRKYYHWVIVSRLRLGGGLLLVLLPVCLVIPILVLVLPTSPNQPSPRDDVGMVIGGCVLALSFGVAGVMNVVQALSYLWNPARHRLLGQLARYGNPLEVARQIDAEIAANEGVLYMGKQPNAPRLFAWRGLWVTPSWVVQVHLQNEAVVRLADLEWVEEARMPTEWNRGNPDSYEVGLVSGERVLFLTTCEERYRLYLALSERCPWILYLKTWPDRKRSERPGSRGDQRGIQAESGEEPSEPDA
jgi:hypothetical protein